MRQGSFGENKERPTAWLRMRPLDLINIIMLGIMWVATLLTLRAEPSNWLLLVAYAGMAAMLVAYPHVSVPWFDLPRRFRQVYPLLYIMIIFDSLARVVPNVNPHDVDDLLVRADRALLGVDPTLYLQRFVHPLAVEVLYVAYVLYFFIPFFLIWGLWREGKLEEITRWACLVTIALYSNYCLYMVFPAKGPYLHLNHQVGLDGLALAGFFKQTLSRLEANKFDVFPSAHVNAAIVTLYGFYRYYRRCVVPAAIVVAGIMIATVYLRYHYVVDVVAGAALAGVSIAAGECYFRQWRSRAAGTVGVGCGKEIAGELKQ